MSWLGSQSWIREAKNRSYFFFLTLREPEDERDEREAEEDLRAEDEEDLDLEEELILLEVELLELLLDEELILADRLLFEEPLVMRLIRELDFLVLIFLG